MSRRCPRCQTVYEGEARFCARDGSPLIEVGGTAASAAQPKKDPNLDSSTLVRTAVKKAQPVNAIQQAGTLKNQVIDKRYQVLRRLGEGGMAYVYEAKDYNTGESVAVKVVTPKLMSDQTAIKRLRREAGLAMRLEHSNVCHIMRLGETEDGLIYLVMPYLAGELLSDREARDGPMSLDVGIPFLVQMCEGLQHAHGLNIIHRDLKPENVMVVGKGSEEKVVIMDFGLAKDHTSGALQKLTATGIVLGTPEFMSPEQVRGQDVDGRSDIYALAILGFEMFTGKLPFEGRTAQETMIARLRGRGRPIREVRPEMPETLERAFLKALEIEPKKRFQNAKEFGEALAAVK
ncbi:MAG: serine/threonine protein kinase [Gemmatimonadota bacterium]|nr:serine/threonine protein kinase [Gemmatimonadota bacterium]MDH5804171.1 serine/threonine protein kinase [Gemmatimonadota bacterium]